MSSDGPQTPDVPTNGIEGPRNEPPSHQIERRLLCERIEQLESELERERRQRQQIVEQYERLLSEQRAKAAQKQERERDRGLLEVLF